MEEISKDQEIKQLKEEIIRLKNKISILESINRQPDNLGDYIIHRYK